jgi:hypothetical protein
MALNQSMQLPGVWRRKSLTRPLRPSVHRINDFKPYQAEDTQRFLALAIGEDDPSSRIVENFS